MNAEGKLSYEKKRAARYFPPPLNGEAPLFFILVLIALPV